MQKIMDRFDVFEHPKHGLIIGATNPELDALSREQIRSLIGEKIEIHRVDGSRLKADVMGVEVANSISDHKSVMICLGKHIKAGDVKTGVEVYGQA